MRTPSLVSISGNYCLGRAISSLASSWTNRIYLCGKESTLPVRRTSEPSVRISRIRYISPTRRGQAVAAYLAKDSFGFPPFIIKVLSHFYPYLGVGSSLLVCDRGDLFRLRDRGKSRKRSCILVRGWIWELSLPRKGDENSSNSTWITTLQKDRAERS